MKPEEMPIGFTMALAENPKTMQKFAMLSEAKKKEMVKGAHHVNSRWEMHEYVKKLGDI